MHVGELGHKVTKTTAYDYEAIEAAVMETGRGRCFLAEFARRRRSADTQALLEAIHKLETVMTSQVMPVAGEALCGELAAMAAALEATEHDMRALRNDLIADRGGADDGRAVFEDVAVGARKPAAGPADTAAAPQAASTGMGRDAAIAGRICGLDSDLAGIEAHCPSPDVLSQRIARAMGLIAHLQDRIRASLADAGAAAAASGPAPPAVEDMPGAGEISYFDADRELFGPAATSADGALAMTADDPENAPHLAGMLDDALAGMEPHGETAQDDRPASEPAPAAGAADAPALRRVVIVRAAPPVAPPPLPDLAAQAAAAPPAAGEATVATPAPDGEPDAIMKMFTEAAAKFGAAPAVPAAPAPQPVAAAPLESMTPGPEERRRIVVIRRASSADTPIPLEETGDEASAATKA